MSDDTTLTDYRGRKVRLTAERLSHLLEHPEMGGQTDRIRQTVRAPQVVVATSADPSVHVYHRHYAETPVTDKYLLVVVKNLDQDAFVLTAFFSNRRKKGTLIWQA